MENPRSKAKMNPLIVEEATAWFIDMNGEELDYARHAEFNEWLRRSPEHMRAYLQVSSVWEHTQILGRRKENFDAALVSARNEVNVFPLDVAREEDSVFTREILSEGQNHIGITDSRNIEAQQRSMNRLRPRSFAIAACLLAVIGAGLVAWYASDWTATYATEIGEQSALMLDDGSTVELNARSRLRVRFSERERNVELVAGQALFRVAKDASRPFVVNAGGTRVMAVGTAFDVYRKSTGTVVTVVEGKVLVGTRGQISGKVSSIRNAADAHRASDAPRASTFGARQSNMGDLLLSAGEQVRVTGARLESPRPAALPMAIAWTDRKLVFDSTPLLEVVEEFNRYNRTQMVIRNAQLNDVQITGVFPSTDSAPMIEFLRRRFGVVVNKDDDTVELRSEMKADEEVR